MPCRILICWQHYQKGTQARHGIFIFYYELFQNSAHACTCKCFNLFLAEGFSVSVPICYHSSSTNWSEALLWYWPQCPNLWNCSFVMIHEITTCAESVSTLVSTLESRANHLCARASPMLEEVKPTLGGWVTPLHRIANYPSLAMTVSKTKLFHLQRKISWFILVKNTTQRLFRIQHVHQNVSKIENFHIHFWLDKDFQFYMLCERKPLTAVELLVAQQCRSL